MRKKAITTWPILLLLLFLVPLSSLASDFAAGFRDIPWGSEVNKIKESDPKLVQGNMGVMPGVEAFQRKDDELSLGGVPVDRITYIFYRGRFSSVAIDYRGFDIYERLFAYCKRQFGAPTGTAVLRLEQYTDFDTGKVGAMLLYQLSVQTSNYGKLYIYPSPAAATPVRPSP